MDIMYNKETGQWAECQEPFASIDFQTREDFAQLIEIMEFWNAHHPEDVIDTTALVRHLNG